MQKIKKVDGGFEILVLLPVEKENITVELKRNFLEVSVKAKNDFLDYDGVISRFSLSDDLDSEKITSEYKNGILKISVPGKVASKKTIDIK